MTILNEEGNNAFTKAALSITDNDAVGGLNALIARATNRAFVTPYIALENIQKIFAQHFIFLPKHSLNDGDQGNLIFHLDQFGSVVGQTDTGEFNLTPDSGLYFYFEYSLNENGFYEVFAEIVDEDDLEEILQDYDGDDAEEDMSEIPASTSDLEYAYNTNQEEHSGMTFSEEKVNIKEACGCETTKRVVEALLKEATYKGKTVSLNKPFRTPGEKKKSAVYVDPEGDGKAKIVRFGDPNLSIKKDQPARKKSYCARSSGQGNLTNKGSANYWSRKAWDC